MDHMVFYHSRPKAGVKGVRSVESRHHGQDLHALGGRLQAEGDVFQASEGPFRGRIRASGLEY